MDPIIAELKQQQRIAWNAADLDTFELYTSIEREIEQLRMVGRAVAGLYKNTTNDDAWTVLYEALSDAGLLTDEGRADLEQALIDCVWAFENAGLRPVPAWENARRVLGGRDPLRSLLGPVGEEL